VHKIPEMVKQAFGQKPMGYGTAIGEAFAPVRTITGGIAQSRADERQKAFMAQTSPGFGLKAEKTFWDIMKVAGKVK